MNWIRKNVITGQLVTLTKESFEKTTHVLRGMVIYLQWKGNLIPWITIIKLICLPLWCFHFHFPMLSTSKLTVSQSAFDPRALNLSAVPSFSFSFVQLTSSPSVPHAGHSESIQASISIFTTTRGSCPKSYRCWDSVVPWWVMGV